MGAESDLMSEKCANSVNLKQTKYCIEMEGITGKEIINTGLVHARFSPWYSTNESDMLCKQFIVMKKLPMCQKYEFNGDIPEFNNLQKADPYFNKRGNAQILFGIESWSDIIEDEIVRSESGLLAQRTKFGHVIFGSFYEEEMKQAQKSQQILSTHVTIDEDSFCNWSKMLERFWEMEEFVETVPSIDDIRAIKYYNETVTFADDGRYIVRIPFIGGDFELGDSRSTALARLSQLERKFKRNPNLKAKYCASMQEAIDLGHMRLATAAELAKPGYFIPHHAVAKDRIVCDASAVTTNGKSFNDIQISGPNLQENLADILLRFRFHRYVFTADIKKMFKQILVHADDLHYQKIYWRFNENEPIQVYVLTTVIFGNKASPFLALMTMQHLAERFIEKYPLAAQATKSERYMDDYITGADTIKQTVELCRQLNSLLAEANMELGKWQTNNEETAQLVNGHFHDQIVELKDEFTKMLGIKWKTMSDSFHFFIENEWDPNMKITKRSIVSASAKLYDPSGFLSPVIIIAKSFIQMLWKLGIKWDDPLPENLKNTWLEYYNGLMHLNKLVIPRWIQTTVGREIELHAFSDASIHGYGGVIYIRCAHGTDVWCNILTSKIKVAPVKPTTIPRLELCATVLLAKLVNRVREKCSLEYVPMYLYTDSTVALYWLSKNPSELKTFVAHRVIEVKKNISNGNWSYVPSKENPADLCSRGLKAQDLVNNSLWWHGPQFLLQSTNQRTFKRPDLSDEERLMVRKEYKPIVCAQVRINDIIWPSIDGVPLIERYESLDKLIRCTASVFKFRDIMMHRYVRDPNTFGRFSNERLNDALDVWIRYTQMVNFSKEIHQLETEGQVDATSPLAKLCPFIDEHSIMRLRGRIANANVSYDERFPIIIPARCHFVRLLMRKAHIITLHGNIQSMIHYVQRKFWVFGAKKAAAAQVNKCVKCKRYKAEDKAQLMGDLPPERLAFVDPFYYCGVDFFGPIKLKRYEGRCRTIDTGYVAVFVCMTTKMIHLECVSNLTATRFLWAFSRFVGAYNITPAKLFSDNGKTFVGAANILKEVMDSWKNDEIDNFLTQVGIQWHFICPKSPFRGGLWEAAVRLTKYHLKRVLSDYLLTFEQYETLLAKITTILNSRPLVAESDDPLNLNYLTPARAIRSSTVMQPLARNYDDVPLNRITQQALLDKIQQEFWKGYRKDYLCTLQNRYKWNRKEENLKVDDFVLLKDDNVPPATWPIARVIEAYEDKDGLVRTVRLLTPKNELTRPVQKLVKLPIKKEDQEEFRN